MATPIRPARPSAGLGGGGFATPGIRDSEITTPDPIDPLTLSAPEVSLSETGREPLGANTKAAIGESAIQLGGAAVGMIAEGISSKKDKEAVAGMDALSEETTRLAEAERARQEARAMELDASNIELRDIQTSFFDRQAEFEREFAEAIQAQTDSASARAELRNKPMKNNTLRDLRMATRRR